jgi:hypothetical protein
VIPEEIEHRRAIARKSYYKHRDKRLAAQRVYQQRPEYREYQRNYAKTEERREASRRWVAANLESHRSACRRTNRKGWAPGEHEKA